MFKAFSKLFQGTTEYGNQNQKNQEKENEIMPKANTNATVNNTKEEKDMKATTKANAKTKENTMQETENKSTKAKTKATTKTTVKAKENTMQNTVTITVNGIQITCTEEQAIAIVSACGQTELSKGKEVKTSAKATAKKSSAKKTATVTENKPATKAEAIEAWKSAKYSNDERKAYGEAAKEVREEMMAENAKMVKTVKGKKVYDDNYYVGAKWTKEFNKRMKARGFSK